jgi:dTDP-4-dehydrorhamnose 3,5-epimerase
MKIIKTEIPDVIVLEPKIFTDSRGFFFEAYNKQTYANLGITNEFVQDNHSQSSYGTLRGIHYQLPPMAQAKLVRVIKGEVFDIAVDLRQGSPTFMKWTGQILSEKNQRLMLVPHGFGHGFLVLSKTAEFLYKCDNFYSPEHDRSLQWDDPILNINWPTTPDMDINISAKDQKAPSFKKADLFL